MMNGAPREVTDGQQVKWSCIEAYGGLNGERAGAAAELAANGGGVVAVVCTPSGGAQSVRLALPPNWAELPEPDLLAAIAGARSAS